MDLKEIISEVRHATGNRDRSPSTAEIRAMTKKVQKEAGDVRSVVDVLLNDRSIGALKLALSLLPTREDSYRQELGEIIDLSDNENWEIREYAADALAMTLKVHFEELNGYLVELRSSSSENVRRAVVVALKYLGKERNVSRCEEILKILAEYMDDNSAYVQRNLGAFAVGDGLIEYCPHASIAMLKKMAKSKSSIARWNVAMVFTAATGTNYFREMCDELLALLRDPEPKVRSAALKAVRTVAQRHASSRSQIKKAIGDKGIQPLHTEKAIGSVLEACND
jgi:HEAT repeat protein